MDKQELIDYIKTLGLEAKIEEPLLKYIDENEFGDEMVENIAQMLESMADMANTSADELDKVIAKMEQFKEGIQRGADQFDQIGKDSENKYMDKVTGILNEELPNLKEQLGETASAGTAPVETAPAEAVPAQPVPTQSETTPVQTVTSQTVVTPSEPIPTQPVQSQTAPMVQNP